MRANDCLEKDVAEKNNSVKRNPLEQMGTFSQLGALWFLRQSPQEYGG